MDHVWIVGLHFRPSSYNGTHPADIEEPTGICIIRPGTDFLLEGCLIEGYGNNVIVQGYPALRTETKIRRNVLVDPVRLDPNNGSTNIYMGQYDGVLIEENVLDNSPAHEAAGAMLSHNIYLGENNPSHNIVRGNIARNGGRTNFNQRSGGVIENNLSIRGAQGITAGISYSELIPSGVIRDNVIIESRNNQNGQNLGFGISLDKVDGFDVVNNLICNATDGLDHKAVNLESSVRNVQVRSNVIYAWGEPQRFGWDTIKLGGVPQGPVSITGNVVQQPTDSLLVTFETGTCLPAGVTMSGNTYWSARAESGGNGWFRNNAQNFSCSAWRSAYETNSTFQRVTFPDPGRTVGGYMSTLSLPASTEAFMQEARRQSPENWRVEFTAAAVNDYLRAGFGMTMSASTP
jgi:hypothetical protein